VYRESEARGIEAFCCPIGKQKRETKEEPGIDNEKLLGEINSPGRYTTPLFLQHKNKNRSEVQKPVLKEVTTFKTTTGC